MITINDGLYIDMSYILPDNTCLELDREITLGLSRARDGFPCAGYELTRGDVALEIYDHQFKDVGIAEKELTKEDLEMMKTLNFNERHRYLKYAKGAYHPWSLCYCLTTHSEWAKKMEPKDKVPTEEAAHLFPKTLKWCYSLPIFKSIGRICIFGVDACQHVTCHRDLNPDKWPLDDELLMISPKGNKKFYIYDPSTNTKHYTDKKAYIFHDLNYHGVDPLPYFTYSVRIDGQYTDEFKKSLKIQRPTR
jgi:hypothetical protein